MSDIYVLQKDLPHAKAGTRFRKGSIGYYESGNDFGLSGIFHSKHVENNKEWFVKEKDYEISKAIGLLTESGYLISYYDQPLKRGEPQKTTLKEIYKKIVSEQPTVTERNFHWNEMGQKLTEIKTESESVEEKAYTQQPKEETYPLSILRATFESARIYIDNGVSGGMGMKYPSFEDYKARVLNTK